MLLSLFSISRHYILNKEPVDYSSAQNGFLQLFKSISLNAYLDECIYIINYLNKMQIFSALYLTKEFCSRFRSLKRFQSAENHMKLKGIPVSAESHYEGRFSVSCPLKLNAQDISLDFILFIFKSIPT